MATVVYTISDFENIKWANNGGFALPANTIELINSLSEQVGAPNYVKTPSFTNNNEPRIGFRTLLGNFVKLDNKSNVIFLFSLI